MRINVACFLLPAALAGCNLAPAYDVPELPVPAQWEHAAEVEDARVPAPDWWREFGSAELDRLVADAVSGNHDLAASVARVEQARASLRIARAALWPFASASASVSHDRTANGQRVTSDDGRVGFSVNYAVDLWGAQRNASESAALRLAISELNRDAVLLDLQTEVALAYFQLLGLEDRTRIALRNLDSARELMRLIQVRFDNGAATALDVAQQRTVLLNIEAQLPSLQQAGVETRNALAVLLGTTSSSLDIQQRSLASIALPTVDPGLPAGLLLRRPDIRAAETALLAANADLGVARAALLPDLALSVSAAATGLLDAGSTTVATLSASLAQTLFAGGELRGRVELSRAVRQELAENYALTVLLALAGVENALSAVTTSERRIELLEQTAAQAREAYRLARVRFDAGAIDLLALLDSQRTLLGAEDALVQARQARLDASAALVRALGG